jgi:hypothetical protein
MLFKKNRNINWMFQFRRRGAHANLYVCVEHNDAKTNEKAVNLGFGKMHEKKNNFYTTEDAI